MESFFWRRSVEAQVLASVFWFTLAGLTAGVLFYGIAIYNNLVRLKHAVSKSWSNIDVVLRQRHEELPKLVETCKQYRQFEGDTLERVMQARTAAETARERGDVKEVGAAERQIRSGLGSLFAVAEAYPELKANTQFERLLARISQLEEIIADRREFYNEMVNSNNVRIEQFPDALLAGPLGFGRADLLDFEESDKSDVTLSALFN
jgi:LemA protein